MRIRNEIDALSNADSAAMDRTAPLLSCQRHRHEKRAPVRRLRLRTAGALAAPTDRSTAVGVDGGGPRRNALDERGRLTAALALVG